MNNQIISVSNITYTDTKTRLNTIKSDFIKKDKLFDILKDFGKYILLLTNNSEYNIVLDFMIKKLINSID